MSTRKLALPHNCRPGITADLIGRGRCHVHLRRCFANNDRGKEYDCPEDVIGAQSDYMRLADQLIGPT